MLIGDEKYVRAGRLRCWTQRYGDPADPAVLLVMGTATPGLGWPDEFVAVLTAAGRQVIRYDSRDTGRSDTVDFAVAPYTLGDLALDAVAVLDGHQVAAAHVVGISMGAAVGQWLAVHRPGRVRTLTAIASSPMNHDPGPAWARAFAGEPADDRELPPPTAAFVDHVSGPRDPVQTWRVLNGGVLPFDEAAARELVDAGTAAGLNHDRAGRRWTDDRRASLSAIAAPTLVVHGDADPLLPVAHGAELAAQIPGARLTVVPGMGHHPFFAPGLAGQLAAHTGPRA